MVKIPYKVSYGLDEINLLNKSKVKFLRDVIRMKQNCPILN